MLLGRFYTSLCKLFYISRPRLPPWAVYFILMPWASVLGFGPGLQSWASALGFGPGRFCVSKWALRARCTGSSYFHPLTRVGFRFLQVCASVWASTARFQGLSCRDDTFSRFACESGLLRALRGYADTPPFQKKRATDAPLYRVGSRHSGYSPVRVGVEHPPPPRHAFRVPLGTGGGNHFQLYESF